MSQLLGIAGFRHLAVYKVQKRNIINRKFEWLYPQKYSELQPIILHAFTLPHNVIFGAILEMVTWEL